MERCSAVELSARIKKRELSVAEAVRACLDSIKKEEPSLHSFITVDEEGALKRAKEVQKQIDAGVLNAALAGVPMALKDNLCTKGLRTTCASNMLADFVPTYNARAVEALNRQGAVLLGKTNMDEFAMGSATQSSAFGGTENPVVSGFVPGGSSGGSCAAVASGECYFALGTDTGGSIRQPAAFCGVVGCKPTYGTVSRYGLLAYASSMDQIGPVTGCVRDSAAVLEAIAAYDSADSTSYKWEDIDFSAALVPDVKGLKIGVPRQYLEMTEDDEIKEAVLTAIRLLEQEGASVSECSLSMTEYALATYYILACAEASSNLARYDGVKYGYRTREYDGLHEMIKKSRSEGFGTEVKRRIMLGTFVLSEGFYDDYYQKALKARRLIKNEFDELFGRYDALLGPTTPNTVPLLQENGQEPFAAAKGDIFTVPANLAGLPALSVPCGKDGRGLPIGLQLMGNHFQEKTLFRIAYALEQGE